MKQSDLCIFLYRYSVVDLYFWLSCYLLTIIVEDECYCHLIYSRPGETRIKHTNAPVFSTVVDQTTDYPSRFSQRECSSPTKACFLTSESPMTSGKS